MKSQSIHSITFLQDILLIYHYNYLGKYVPPVSVPQYIISATVALQ